MIRLDDSLAELVRAGTITEEIALRSADNRKELTAALHPAPTTPVATPAKKGGLFNRGGGDR